MDTIRLSSEKEKLVLALWACSQTVKESARYLQISVRSVNYYRGRLRCKLGANSSTELIRKLLFMDEYETLIRLGRNFLLTNYGPMSRQISSQELTHEPQRFL